MVVVKRKETLKISTARLLVLGDKQVGKSATIVRYTTGRFIQEYSSSTQDWLYRHWLGFDSKRNMASVVEVLEQNDLRFFDSNNIFARPEGPPVTSNSITGNNSSSLATRVALDQQLDSEIQEKQQMLNKMHWANAFIVIYAINDTSTFNKAIKYLNLIANNINSTQDKLSPRGNNSNKVSSSVNSDFNKLNTSNKSNDRISHFQSSSQIINSNNKNSNHFGAQSPVKNMNPKNYSIRHSTTGIPTNCSNSRRPILLLGNKKDLETSARQVNKNDARMLALRHHSMFAEVSIADSSKLIDTIIVNLVEQIDPTSLYVDPLTDQQLNSMKDLQSTLEKWSPGKPCISYQQLGCNSTAPVWASLVKSLPTGSSIAQSKTVAVPGVEMTVQSTQPLTKKQTKSAKTINSYPEEREAHRKTLEVLSPVNMTISDQHHSRYETLKSSFKKASMAIVSSKALARGSKPPKYNSATPKRSSVDFEKQTESKDSSIIDLANVDAAVNRFRRPLFRYKSRRKTVAFEPVACQTAVNLNKSESIVRGQCKQLNSASVEGVKDQSLCRTNSSHGVYEGKRNSCTRSSSSLSTTDTYYTPTPTPVSDNHRASSSTGSSSVSSGNYSSSYSSNQASKCDTKGDSRSTLSRNSTPAGSYEDSGDDIFNVNQHQEHKMSSQVTQATQCDGLSLSSKNKKSQLVKSVHNTLTNLTRSSNASALAAKRSFCNTLLKYTAPNSNTTPIRIENLTGDFVKAQSVRIEPVIGYCE